ncbi:glycerophosphodiester phosphodiesterase [Metabacillus halosaccharovorans]|uniref:glycerophosphodiester phosphodiesterase n=1 Tax=Metabacillus halosaccharovorans TaxID=930124 RepID=UPI00203AA05A|nr:glycerophosphodiester phosphodiesterase [Metabacillus halosaccharovorans]MCM3439345.1 glycerophosphodiester phosphodiesterase [Metabacillus halosaccharovorans]
MKKSLKKTALLCLTLGFALQVSLPGAAAAGKSDLPSPETKLLNVAHRGASGHAPEHTITAYELGKQMKGDYIEIDLQMTKDGHLIAMHDETVDRTTDGIGLVKDKTLEEIKELDAGSWFNERYPDFAKKEYEGLQIPTLEEVFKRFGRSAEYYIETKSPDVYPGMEEKLLELLDEYKLTGVNGRSSHVIIQSFSQESLLKIHKINPTIPLVQLISYPTPASITDEEIKKLKEYAVGVGPNFARIDQTYVEKVRANDLHIHPYTINEKEDIRKALEWGVTGVFTNFPDRFNEVLKEFKNGK